MGAVNAVVAVTALLLVAGTIVGLAGRRRFHPRCLILATLLVWGTTPR